MSVNGTSLVETDISTRKYLVFYLVKNIQVTCEYCQKVLKHNSIKDGIKDGTTLKKKKLNNKIILLIYKNYFVEYLSRLIIPSKM